MGAGVTLFHVMPEVPGMYFGLGRMEETVTWLLDSPSELGVNLRREMELLQSLGVPAEVRLGHGSVLSEMLRELHEGSHDMVVSGSALSRGLRTYVLGDVTREIVNRADCAVLVVRGPRREADARRGLRGFLGRDLWTGI